MHRIHHRAGGAVLADERADFRNVGERGALAAELFRDQDRQEPRLFQRGERFVREARFPVHLIGVLRGDCRDFALTRTWTASARIFVEQVTEGARRWRSKKARKAAPAELAA